MTSVTRVPETASPDGSELAADAAWSILRDHGVGKLARDAFVRLRYGDGFSHSRALGLQLSLAIVPLVIVIIGLSSTLRAEGMRDVLQRTVLSLLPSGAEGAFAVTLTQALQVGSGVDEEAMGFGLVIGLVALTTAMGQVERGSNRVYGIRRDRPASRKYTRAFCLAVGAGLPALVGVMVLLAVYEFSAAVQEVYGTDASLVAWIGLPAAVSLLLSAITIMFRYGPRRHQPAFSWLAVGALLSLVLLLGFTGLFAAYLAVSNSFDTIYGQLAGVMVLLLWSQLASISIFYGLAFAAQLEAVRAHMPQVRLPAQDIGLAEGPEARHRFGGRPSSGHGQDAAG